MEKDKTMGKKRAYKMVILFTLIFTAGIFIIDSPTLAQGKRKDIKIKDKKNKDKKNDKSKSKAEKKDKKDKPQAKTKNFWQPEVTAYFTIPMAMSAPLSDLFGMGFGGHFAMTFRLSGFLPPLPIGVRAGFLAGYSTFSGADGDFTADSTRIPVIAFAEADIRVHTQSFVTRFIGRYGHGMALTAASSAYPNTKGETVSGSWSSADSALMAGAGLGLNIKSLPNVEFQVMAHFFQVFQTLSGSFLDVNIGVSYRFGKWE